MADRLTVCAWKWGRTFGPEYVNRLRAALERHLHLPHELVCITDDPTGIDRRVRIVTMPTAHAHTIRCRRRMWHFARERREDLGSRLLCVDLDLVLVDDITPVVDRPEPIVCWRVGYANVYTGAWVLFDAGALDGAWDAFRRDPEGFPASTGQRNASETAMLTHWIRSRRVPVAEWTERDGLIMWFGDGYEHLEHHGLSPRQPTPPPGTRLVMFGGADKAVLDTAAYPWIASHWTSLEMEAVAP